MKSMMKKLYITAILTLSAFHFSVSAQSADFDSGMKSAQAGDFQTAVVRFQDSLDKNLPVQKQAQIHYNIGACFYRLQQFDEAITELERAVLLKDDYEKAFYALGMAYADSQKWTLAELAFQKTIKLDDGKNGEAWFDLAFVYIGQKNYDEALKSFRKAIKYGSGAAAASHNNIGVIYAMKGNTKMAYKEIETAKKLGFELAADNLENLVEYMRQGERALVSGLFAKKSSGRQP